MRRVRMMHGQSGPRRTMKFHTESVNAVAFFKDGQRVVTGSSDFTLQMWDVQKGALVGGSFYGHKGGVLSVAVSPDERTIASGGTDNTIIIWDVQSKQKIFDSLMKHTDQVNAVCFSPDGNKLASGSADSSVVLWNVDTGAVLATLQGHQGWVMSVAFSPDGLKLATSDYTIRIWRTDKPELLLQINTVQYVRSVVWSHDGWQLLCASSDGTVKFWNSSSGEVVGQPCTHPSQVYSLAINPDGFFIATAPDDNTVRLWSTVTCHQIVQPLEHTTTVVCVAISPNGELLVSGDNVGKVRLWSIKDILEQHKTEESGVDNEETPRKKLITLGDTQPNGDPDNRRNRPSQTVEVPEVIYDACIAGDLHTAEVLLTQMINEDDNRHDHYFMRSTVSARISEWDNALQDAAKSIAIQPSLFGYISKGIALCGNQQLEEAMEAFDLALISVTDEPEPDQILIIIVLLLFKAVVLFNAGHHDKAMRRVQNISSTYQHSDTYLCSVVNSYLRLQLAIIAFENGQYGEAADQLTTNLTTIIGLFSRRRKTWGRKLEIFTFFFGWEFDSIRKTINQRRCDAFLRADRVIEAAESLQYMMSVIDEYSKYMCLEWSTAFKEDCIARCVSKAEEAHASGNYELAIELCSAAIRLDSSRVCLFVCRCMANLALNCHEEALTDANKVIKLSGSYRGFELKHEALHGAQRYDEAIIAFNTMLTKLKHTRGREIRKLRQQYVSQSQVEDATRKTVHAQLDNAPLRLLNTSTGRLCDREAQIITFMESAEYKKLSSSLMMHPAPLQTEPIREAVAKHFRWVMLSHRWESKEPLLHDIKDKAMYDLDPVGTTVKLQRFCKIAHDAGYLWAWSDTCCIDQSNNVELQRSVNSMFVWYRHSALTIVYLSDVPPRAKSGALASSVWNTRGWTVQEFLAPHVVLFYNADWTLYLNDRSPNHKKSVTITQELEHSTGIDAQDLVAFSLGMTNACEKLQWASMRITTLQEDIAYSLFGIFGVHLHINYGERKQNALGRLLEVIIARSGDITALDWVGKSSEFNSCFPADIISYKAPPCLLPSLSEDEMQSSVSMLRQTVPVESALKLYTLLDNLSAPRFTNFRLQLPCIVFPVTEIRWRNDEFHETYFTYNVKANGLHDLLINTEDRLFQFSRARPIEQTFLLVRPCNRHDLGLPDFADDKTKEAWFSRLSTPWSMSLSTPLSTPMSPPLPLQDLGGSPKQYGPVELESHSRALRLIVSLGQPFSAFLLAQQRGGEYKRIASDRNIIAEIKNITAVRDMMDVRTLDIL